MKAAYMTRFGGPEVFSVGEIDIPECAPATFWSASRQRV